MAEKAEKSGKAKEIILGILTAAALWGIGLLLSGHLTFAEDIQFHKAGILAFAFPLIVFAAFVLIAKYSSEKGKATYYKTSIICSFIPLAASTLLMLLSLAFSGNTTINLIAFIFSFLYVPAVSIMAAMFEFFDKFDMNTVVQSLLIVAVNLVPMLAGLLVSLRIYKNNGKS